MPNPSDFERLEGTAGRSAKLMGSALTTAKTKQSWSEWFGSPGWLAGTARTQATAVAASGVTGLASLSRAGQALAAFATVATGVWGVGLAAAVVMEVAASQVDDKIKEWIPQAFAAARAAVGRAVYGGQDPALVIVNPITKNEGGKDVEYTLEEISDRIKTNVALLQDLLDRLAGKAGAARFCDDAYQIAALAYKSAGMKGELTRDLTLLREFVTDIEGKLNRFDPSDMLVKAKALSEAICGINDGRHWDNSWTQYTVTFGVHCSKQHCYGPRLAPTP